MARLLARGLFAALAVALFPAVQATAEPGAPRAAAATLWPTTRFHGTDYVDARDLAERLGLKITRAKEGLQWHLAEGGKVRLVLEDSNRDFYFDGLRIFLGQPVINAKGTLWVSRIDVIKLIAPLFRPADRREALPATPPRTIVLDAGHGGSDPGKENLTVGINEKAATLDVVLRLKKLLELEGWRVLLTRADDSRLASDQVTDLQRRAEFANKNQADLFLSVHFNSAPGNITGIETYSMAPQFMLSTSDDKKDEMTDKAFPSNKRDYANLLFGERIHRALLHGLKTPDRGFKRGRLLVLRFVECPGVLVECGYLSNDAEARRVASPEFRAQIAQALADGLRNYAAALAALGPPPAPARSP